MLYNNFIEYCKKCKSREHCVDLILNCPDTHVLCVGFPELKEETLKQHKTED